MNQGRVEAGALILAGGRSSRFGGFPKALARFKGRSLLETAADKCRLVGVSRIVVVTGHHHPELVGAARALGLEAIHNPDYDQGMFSSLKIGLQGLGRLEAFFAWPVDSALTHPQSLLSILSHWRHISRARPGTVAVIPTFGGFSGHPPLISSRASEKIDDWDGPGGLRGWLGSLMDEQSARQLLQGAAPKSPRGPISFLALPDEALLGDIDYYEQLLNARESAGRPRPSLNEAWQLLFQRRLGRDKMEHCRQVAAAALRLALALRRSGFELDPDLALLGGLLHDLASGQARHALVGRLEAEALGWPKIGQIIGVHTDLPAEYLDGALSGSGEPASGEAAGEDGAGPAALPRACLATYLADKYFLADRAVSLASRFDQSERCWRHRPEALRALRRRQKTALEVENLFRKWLGAEPRSIAHQPTDDPREARLARLPLGGAPGRRAPGQDNV
ncbi:MAG: NTP transferase domain-containing protein [Candidatus Adiutrix sp.]|jgi:CTP:molybdopterin cytidylyltransferase MocA|nr:NTP transferase domain-containing protein [Candidatus Adiutrix sp.]